MAEAKTSTLATQALIKEEQEAALRNAISLIHKYCDGRWRIFAYAARETAALHAECGTISPKCLSAMEANIALADAILAIEQELTAALIETRKKD